MKRIALFILMLWSVGAAASPNLQNLLQMLDYVSVDYPEAVVDGEVVNAAEFNEMLDFGQAIGEQIGQLPAGPVRDQLSADAEALRQLVARKGDARELKALAAGMRERIFANFDVVVVPRRAPDFALAADLYAANCASCHGAEGRGDGPAGQGLEPPPIDFTDRERHFQQSIYGLYNTITLGVDGTGMKSFHEMSEEERWSLAFYVARLGAPEAMVERGEELAGEFAALADLRSVTTSSPEAVAGQLGEDAAARLEALRANPSALFTEGPDPLQFAREQLGVALEAARRGDRQAAYNAAVTGYLEGFELTEASLNAVDGQLRAEIEKAMTQLRSDIRSGAPVAQLEQQIAGIEQQLTRADELLGSTSLSGVTAFTGSLVILLREGLEAILVVTALAAFLVKTGRRDGLRYLHAGWLGALAAGAATWWVSTYVITIGGAGRELTEGVAALVAAFVLFGVGFWMHGKSNAAQWKQFIEKSVQKALNARTLWALAGLSFIAVYREVFETILFYQALWVQAAPAAHGTIVGGMLTAVAILAVLSWLIMHYSPRLPLRQFFGVTGILMLVLAVVFAGKGVVAFQEAGKLPTSPVELLPTIELLGIYPNLQAIGLQLAMVVIAIAVTLMARKRPHHPAI